MTPSDSFQNEYVAAAYLMAFGLVFIFSVRVLIARKNVAAKIRKKMTRNLHEN